MRAEATVRNAGLLFLLRGLALAGGVLYAALVPRSMGPEAYGVFALVTSLSVWFELASGLGLTQVISRETPLLQRKEGPSGLRRFFGSLLTLRLASGLVASAAFFLLTRLWLQEIDVWVLAAVAATVVIQGVGATVYSFFLGLNQAARWGANDVLSRWVPIGFLVVGYRLNGLPGACLGLVVAELIIAFVALFWARSHLSWEGLRTGWSRLIPYLRFALGFYISALILAVFQRSGEPLVRLFTGDYVQVAYFGLAASAIAAADTVIPQVTSAFAPFLTTLQALGDPDRVARWAERLVRWLGILGVVAIAGAFLMGSDFVLVVLGEDFAPVSVYLVILALTLIPQAVSSVSRMLAVVYIRPGEVVRASILRLALLWILGPVLLLRLGGVGACFAILAATTGYAIALAWRMRRAVSYSFQRWGMALALGGIFVPLIWLRGAWWINAGLFALFLAIYAGLLMALRLVGVDEIKAALQVLRRRPETRLAKTPPSF